MRTTLLIITSFLLSSVSAQNWELFKAGETYNFNKSDIHGARIDSVQTTQNDTTFYFNRIVNDTVDRNFSFANYPIEDITQPNIFGDKVVKRNDSLVFENQFGNKLYLKPKAHLNSIWNFVNIDTLRVEAKVDSIFADTVNGILDSIKLISFQSFDSSNNALNHTINAKTIYYSKSNGFLMTFNFYEDVVGRSLNSTYKINYTRIFQSTYFTREEAYDLAIGDEYHFNYLIYKQNSPNDIDNYNHKVQNRTISSNGDTIILSFLENKKSSRSTVDYSTSPPTLVTTISYSNRTFKRTVLNPTQSLDSALGFEPKITFDSNSNSIAVLTRGYSFYMPYSYSQTTYNNRIVISLDHRSYIYDSTQNSWVIPYTGKNFYDHTLTGIFSFVNTCNNQNGGGCTPSYHTLTYFKKGTETWGTPIIITGIDQFENSEHAEAVSIYPNPANDQVSFTTKQKFNKLDYQLMTLKGKLLDSGQLNPNSTLNTSHLADGIYFLLLQSENFKETKKLIIQR